MHVSSVSASFRQGMTTDTSTVPWAGTGASAEKGGAAEMGWTWVKRVPP